MLLGERGGGRRKPQQAAQSLKISKPDASASGVTGEVTCQAGSPGPPVGLPGAFPAPRAVPVAPHTLR